MAMTMTEALDALQNGRLDFTVDDIEDRDAAPIFVAFTEQLKRVLSEAGRIMSEIAVEGKLGGQMVVPGAMTVFSQLVVDVNMMSWRVTEQIRDLSQTIAAQRRSEQRPVTVEAAGEIKLLIDGVNALGAGDLASGVNQMAEQLQANIQTLASRVEETTDEVRRLLDERTQLFASLSHEFRTPLAVILRQAELLMAQGDGHEAAQAIRESGQELLGVVNDVLELAKAETGSLDMTFEPIDVAEELRTMEPTFQGLASRVGISFTMHVSGLDHRMLGDARRLRQAALNLVDNAVKYTPSGGKVSLELNTGSAVMTLVVRDTGIGIPALNRNRIFEPFYRADGPGTQHGEPSTGLGLALTKRIIDEHGGHITLSSYAGGTTFLVSLPRLREEGAKGSTNA
jgi:signal transduction histidine kinase